MASTQRAITLAAAFPALAPALDLADHAMPLVTALRLRRWDSLAQTLALSACRRRDATLGELTQFPLPWLDRELGGAWTPSRCRQPGARTLRTLDRAGLRRWRDLAERTPPQILDCSGAGLILLSEIVACALELAAAWLTDPHVRQSTSVFGYTSCVSVREAEAPA
jgi:hypothetical protein